MSKKNKKDNTRSKVIIDRKPDGTIDVKYKFTKESTEEDIRFLSKFVEDVLSGNDDVFTNFGV